MSNVIGHRYPTVRFGTSLVSGTTQATIYTAQTIGLTLGPGVDDIDNYSKVSNIPSRSEKGNSQAGFKLAPPTKNPSMSFCFASSLQFFSLTEPP